MSTYDMYFSKKNKNYMYDILSKVIYDETKINILNSNKYIDLYRLYYSNIFNETNTDELSVLNSEIINKIGKIIINDIKNEKINISSIENNYNMKNINYNTNNDKKFILYSSQRENNSLNRYNFNILLEHDKIKPTVITLCRENNSLFTNTNINVRFNNKDNLIFTFKNKNVIDNNEYYNYECITDDIIECSSNKLSIEILDYLMNCPLRKTDIYNINKIKKIYYQNRDFLCIDISNNINDININDKLGLFTDNITDIISILYIKHIIRNYILINYIDIDINNNNYKCFQMNKSITLNYII